MKKRLYGLALVLVLAALLLPGAVRAEGGLCLEVRSEAELQSALNRSEPVAEIHVVDSFSIASDCSVLLDPAHFDNYRNVALTVEEGMTLTIEAGGVLGVAWYSFEGDWNDGPDAHVFNDGTVIVAEGGCTEGDFSQNNGLLRVQSGGEAVCVGENRGTVTVESGGAYRTTQGGDAKNYGRVEIRQGAVLESRMGSTFFNVPGGELVLDGDFLCGCVGETMWFENQGVVRSSADENQDGSGWVYVYQAAPDFMPSDLDAMRENMLRALGITDESFPFRVFALYEVGDESELATLLCDDEADARTAARITGKLELTAPLRSMGVVLLDAPEASLTVAPGASLICALRNQGGVRVEPGAKLGTTMGGPYALVNAGTLEVAAGAELWSQYGGSVVNTQSGTLSLDGCFYCGGFFGPWFGNAGTVRGSGWAALRMFSGLEHMVTSCRALELALGDAPIPVYAQATTAEDFCALAALEGVPGIYVSGQTELDPGEEYEHRVRLDGAVALTKALWIGDGMDLVPDPGATLRLPGYAEDESGHGNLVFGRTGRILAEPGDGGTLILGGVKLLSGSDESAVCRPTERVAWLSAPSYYPDADYPAGPEWLYVCDGGAAELGGSFPTDGAGQHYPNLILGEGSAATVTAPLELGYLEVRSALDIAPGAGVKTWDVFYFNASSVTGGEIEVEHESRYQCLLVPDPDDPAQSVPFPVVREGRIYLEDNGVEPYPTSEQGPFLGWQITSGWSEIGPEALAAYTVQTDEEGRHYVDEPRDFPILVTARYGGVSLDREAGELRYTLSLPETAAETVQVLAAWYDAAGRLLDLTLEEVPAEDLTGSLPMKAGAASCGLFLADRAWTPLCAGWHLR